MVVQQAIINASSAGANTIVGAESGKVIRVVGIHLVIASAVTVTWQSTTAARATNLTGPQSYGDTSGMTDCWNPEGLMSGAYFFQTGVGEALTMSLGSGVQVSGTVNYILI